MTDPDLSQGSPPLGMPAFRPSKSSAGPDDPVFTEQDARDFVERHGVRSVRIRATGPFVAEKVEFVRGEAIGSPVYELLCLVTVRGDFQLLSGPAPPPGATPGPPVAFDRVVQVFDAHTGNLLGSDAFPAATPTR